MPTICPNCLRPVRADAKYCGYCGSTLDPISQDAASAVSLASSTLPADGETSGPRAQPGRKSRNLRRTLLIVIIILLCLVLLFGFFMHYLSVIGASLYPVFTLP